MSSRSLLSPASLGAALTLVLTVTLIYGAYEFKELKVAYLSEREANATLTYESNDLSAKLDSANSLADDLKTLLAARQAEKEGLGQQVQSLSSTVGVLDALSKTDRQLLEKYSSVYFLNENYTPAHLTQIDAAYLSRPNEDEFFLSSSYRHLTDLLDASRAASSTLLVLSAYRSFGTQALLKEGYKVTYGAGTANSFSADQGYSEHQLGTAVDFTTPSLHSSLTGFNAQPGYTWLLAHAYEYGFILSYPKANGHFVFEPWHWRYVGVSLATRLHSEGKNFYDLDQRDIDTYLVHFND